MSAHASVVAFPTPVDLHTIAPGQRFSPTDMPYAVLALLTVQGVDAHDGSHRWAAVLDLADGAKHLVHGQLVKLHRTDRVYLVAQLQLATYCRCAQ